MKKMYLENLTKSKLLEIMENNDDLKYMIRDIYIDNTMNYIDGILEDLNGVDYSIGFSQYYNFWTADATLGQLYRIIKVQNDYGIFDDECMEVVEETQTLYNKLYNMSYDNKQYNNLKDKLIKQFHKISDLITNTLKDKVDYDIIDNNLLVEQLRYYLEENEKTYYIDKDTDSFEVYKIEVSILS